MHRRGVSQAGDEQERAAEQGDAHGHLSHYQHAFLPAAARPGGALFRGHDLPNVQPESQPCRRHPGKQHRQQHGPQDVSQHPQVEPDSKVDIDRARGDELAGCLHQTLRQQDAQSCARKRDQAGLHQQLSGDAPHSGAQRQPHAQFLLAGFGLRQPQLRHVGARHEKHAAQNEQQSAAKDQVAGPAQRELRLQERAGASGRRRLVLALAADGGVQHRGGVCGAHAGFQPRDHFELTVARLLFLGRSEDVEPGAGAHPDVRADAALQPVELPRHHSGHQKRLSVEQNALPHDVRIAAESPLPQAVSQHRRRASFDIVDRRRAGLRSHSQNGEIVGGDGVREHHLALVGSGQHRAAPLVGHERDQIRRGLRHVLVVQPTILEEVTVVGAGIHLQEFAGPFDRDGAKQQRIRHAEESRGQTDSQRDRKDGQRRRPRAFREVAKRHAKVVPQLTHA